MKNLKTLLLGASAALLMTSCVSVSTFEEQPQKGGELVVSTFLKDKDGPEARMMLEDAMRANCSPNGFVIDTKRFVKTGSVTTHESEQKEGGRRTDHIRDIFGDVSSYEGGRRSRSSSTSTTSDTYQWRVKYHCVRN